MFKDILFVTSEWYKSTTHTSGEGKTYLNKGDSVWATALRETGTALKLVALLALYCSLQVTSTWLVAFLVN